MRYAINSLGEKIEVTYSKEEAICPDCNSKVFGRYGLIKPKHWSHAKTADCDKWYEPITQWHIDWQNKFDKEYQEIRMTDNLTGEIHRADVKLPNGTVIEIQNSPIKPEEIEKRESFYGRENMIWIINGGNLMQHCKLLFTFIPTRNCLQIAIADHLPNLQEYDMDEFREKLMNRPEYIEIKKIDKNCKINEMNGNYLTIDFQINRDLGDMVYFLQRSVRELFTSQFGFDKLNFYLENFQISYEYNLSDKFEYIRLYKKHWRKFLDYMSFPVFIDNLADLKSDYIYYLQGNQIISKSALVDQIFLNKSWASRK